MENQETFSEGKLSVAPAAVFGVDLSVVEDLKRVYLLLR
jgi:hypothetical protein